eukprot:2680473-Prymnesium_polylepis.1
MEYKRVVEQVIPAYASGFRRWHGPADDAIVIRLQTKAPQAAVCMPLTILTPHRAGSCPRVRVPE